MGIKDIAKRLSRTVRFKKERTDDYDEKFERIPVKPTQKVDLDRPASAYDRMREDELVVLLDRSKGDERKAVKAALDKKRAAKEKS